MQCTTQTVRQIVIFPSLYPLGVPFSSVHSVDSRLSLASKAHVCSILRCACDIRFTCTRKTLANYLRSLHWRRIRGTIIQLCRKEPALGQITHHHHHHRVSYCPGTQCSQYLATNPVILTRSIVIYTAA